MPQRSNEYFLAFARDLVLRAGVMAMKNFQLGVGNWIKENKTLVTQVDLDIQNMLRREIRSSFPDHGFLGEEVLLGGGDPGPNPVEAEWLWVADPIDGTEAYTSGLPVWGISLALLYQGEPVAAVFYQPVTEELYHAEEASESMLTLHPGKAYELNRAISVNTDPGIDNRSLFLVNSDTHRFWISDFPGKQRILGSVAAHQCIVARGAAVATLMRAKIWDIAASALIVSRAGGVTLDYHTGEPISFKPYLETKRMPLMITAASSFVSEKIKTYLHPRDSV